MAILETICSFQLTGRLQTDLSVMVTITIISDNF